MGTARNRRRKDIQKARRWVMRRRRGHDEPYPLEDTRPLEIALERMTRGRMGRNNGASTGAQTRGGRA